MDCYPALTYICLYTVNFAVVAYSVDQSSFSQNLEVVASILARYGSLLIFGVALMGFKKAIMTAVITNYMLFGLISFLVHVCTATVNNYILFLALINPNCALEIYTVHCLFGLEVRGFSVYIVTMIVALAILTSLQKPLKDLPTLSTAYKVISYGVALLAVCKIVHQYLY